MLFTMLPAAVFAEEGVEPAAQEPTSQTLPESDHNYANSLDQSWSYELEGATAGVLVTFDAQTATESGYDYIYVLDADGNEVGKYSGTELAGATVAVPTSKFTVRLTSDRSGDAWGFKVTSVEAVKAGNLEQTGAVTIGDIPSIMLGDAMPEPTVTYVGKTLEKDTDYELSYSDNDKAGTATVTITGKGSYYGTISATFVIADDNNLQAAPELYGGNVLLRQAANDAAGETGTSYIRFQTNLTSDYISKIESITLTPVDSQGNVESNEEGYPNAAKTITLTKNDYGTKWYVKGSDICFYRTSDDPAVYVTQGHEPIEIKGRWSTNTYPQSQIYQVSVKAKAYQDATGTVTYYTGTADGFSIIVEDEDGSQEVVKTWTIDELDAMSSYANGSSQCGMTGFRTFSGIGVSLKDLLEDAGVTVSDDDYFLLDTSDHYGNEFTYDELFNTTRYFLSSIYDDEEVIKTYQELVKEDDEAGATIELRKALAQAALKANSTVEPRINFTYVETLISGDEVGTATLPTKENYNYSSLVSYENLFRFFYGIALVQEDVTVTFDSNGGSDVDSQLVKSHLMTSTANTTIKSSYWVNSLVIYRGKGAEHKTEASTAADTINEPTAPTREGYVFGGWYTDKDCTDGNEFDFTANDGTVDANTTLYAKWIPTDVSDLEISTDHYDVNGTDTQYTIATLTFGQSIQLANGKTLADLKNELAVQLGSIGYESDREFELALGADGKSLEVTVANGFAMYGGNLTILPKSSITALTYADGTPVQIAVSAVVDNGIYTEIVSQTVGTDTTPASVTVKLNATNEEGNHTVRGMVHMALLSNGESALGDLNAYGGNLTGHWHMYTTLTPETFLSSNFGSESTFAATLKNAGYTVTVDGDQLTITATTATNGQILDLHVVNYRNNGTTAVDKFALTAQITAAKAIDTSKAAVSALEKLQSALSIANNAANSDYYSQSDVTAITAQLKAACAQPCLAGHSWNYLSGKVTKASTATQTGTVVYPCANCDETQTQVIPVNKYPDVTDTNQYYYVPALWATSEGLVKGMDDGSFNPSGDATRAQMVTILWRAAGEPEPTSTVNPFTDVVDTEYTHWYYKAVLWGVEKGIIHGMTATTFEPNTVCSRAMILTMLYRAEGEPDAGDNNPFVDVKDTASTNWYYDAVLWAAENGVANGMDATHFVPATECARAAMVTFLYRNAMR
jgi:uncharacterized repeat protein (TIGR02543 family)